MSTHPRFSFLRFAAGLALAAQVAFFCGTASARSHLDLAWPVKDVFHIAVRFLHVDRGCKIIDRDPESAYITFECPGETGKPPHKGALELIAADVQSRNGVRAQLTLSDDPSYVEGHLLELLERKVRDERGAVLPPPRPPAPSPDAGR